jgi:hypothetical protein
MTYSELSDMIDVMSNRYAQQKEVSLIPFDEYEKSLFLTKAANEIVKEMLPFYDRNEKIKKQLITITKSASVGDIFSMPDAFRMKLGSLVYELPADAMYAVAESLRDPANVILRKIRPLKDDETYYTLDNPFRTPSRGYAFRNGLSYLGKKYSEIITDITPDGRPEYFIKYICNIPPFIVTDDLEDASINGVSTNSSLDNQAPLDVLHEKILDRAIIIGYTSKSDDPNSKVTALGISKDS